MSDLASTLAVLGAGPKAAALAAKAHVLRGAGLPAPQVVVIERGGPAANWTGARGYTDGQQPLGTPPAKDVGYPYPASWGTHSGTVQRAMLAFSWPAFLVERGHYAEWVDRGELPPTHGRWGEYLRWVFARSGVECIQATLTRADLQDGHWRLTGQGEAGEVEVTADALVVTGTGPPLTLPGQPVDHPRVTDGRTFWTRLATFSGLTRPASVAVVGAGETAASVAVALLARLPGGSTVEVVTGSGVLYTRGESFWENRLYSNPLPEWPAMAERHRREFLRRTDRGVFSVRAQETLNGFEGLRTVAGRVLRVEPGEDAVVLDLQTDGESERIAFDHVVVATGFDPLWWEALLGEETRAGLSEVLGGKVSAETLERVIDVDLSVRGLTPKLHLPMLAGLAQGPGFPNLSCLGLLADRVLGGLVERGKEHGLPGHRRERHGA